jgi:preprotein translocase subunit SecA
MAGRGTDIMLGGNPEFLAKKEMRKLGFEEDLIAMATGTVEIDDEAVKEARRVFSELYGKFKEEIRPEAERVREAGGLFILGTERHESRRIDNQLRGRSGRQGDPGESRFYLSLEDDLMRLFGSERLIGMVERLGLPDDMPIDAKILSGRIEGAQKRIEDQNFKRRKYVLTYDDVMNQQRNLIYKQRNDVLSGNDISETVKRMIRGTVEDHVNTYLQGDEPTHWDLAGLREAYRGMLTEAEDFRYEDGELRHLKKEDVLELLCDRADALYREKEELIGADRFREMERAVLLQCVDRSWMEHIDAMEDLKDSIRLQSYAQRDPVNEYRLQGADMFEEMVAEIRSEMMMLVLTATPRTQTAARVQVAKPLKESFEGAEGQEKKKTVVVRKAEKVGRNDLCPCGSGKKYKKCCGAPGGNAQ